MINPASVARVPVVADVAPNRDAVDDEGPDVDNAEDWWNCDGADELESCTSPTERSFLYSSLTSTAVAVIVPAALVDDVDDEKDE